MAAVFCKTRQKKAADLEISSFVTTLITSIWLLLPPHHAKAQDVPQETGLDYLELSPQQLFSATVISATKTLETWWDTPAAIYVLNNEDIKRSGATSIPDILRLVPGVQVAQINSGSWAISVRGFNNDLANKLLVLIDGREVYDHLFSGVYWDVQDLMLEDVERIEVIRGPGSTLWGANAVNGVINIITKKAHDTQGTLVSVATGNQERAIIAARYGKKMGENGSYRLYGKHLDRDEQQTFSGTGAQDDGTSYRGGFRADWENPAKNESFTVQGDAYQSRPSQIRLTPTLTTEEEKILAHGGNILGRYEYIPETDARLTVKTYIDYTFRDQLLLEDERASFDLDMQYEYPTLGSHKLVVGGNYHFSKDRLAGSPLVTFGQDRARDQALSGFFQDKITVVPDTWFLTLGSKVESNNYTGVELQPNARLQWHPNDHQMIWSSVARAVRTPSRLDQDIRITQLQIAGSPIIVTLGNTELDSEILTAYELGYRHQWTDDLQFDVSAFYNDYTNLSVYTLQSVGPATYLPKNEMTGEAFGTEAVTDWQATENISLTAAYSLMELQLHNHALLPLSGPEVAEKRSPQHQLNVRALWDVADNVTLDSAVYYVDALGDYGVNEYWRFDTRLGWQLTDQLEFSLAGQNLFNNVHREFLSTSGLGVRPTRIKPSIYGKLTWTF